MSFMPVAGKIFVCAECQKKVPIDYVGGSLETQIGDMAVNRQLEYSEHLGQPSANPYEEGFYLYDIGVCGECYEKMDSPENRERYEQIFHSLDEIQAERNQALQAISFIAEDTIGSIASGLTLQDIGSAVGSPIDASFGDKHAAATKKQRMITGFVQNYSNRIQPYILEKAFAEGPIHQILEQYRGETKPLTNQLTSLLGLTQGKGYLQKHTNAAENLNDYIISDMTVREPVAGAIDEIFYYPVEYDVPELMQFLAIRPEDSEIHVHMLVGKKQLCTIIEKLTMPETAH